MEEPERDALNTGDDADADLATDDAASTGDYYYLRVNQLDGSRAWSSPWWVGGRGRESSASAARAGQR